MPAYDSSGAFITNTIGSTFLLTLTCKNQTNSKIKQAKKLGRSSCTAKIKQFYQDEIGGMLSTILAKLSSKKGIKHSQQLEQTICVHVIKDFGNCIHTKIIKQNLRRRNQWIKIRRKKDQEIWVNSLINLILIKVECLKRMV